MSTDFIFILIFNSTWSVISSENFIGYTLDTDPIMGVYDMVSRVDVLHEICQERDGGGVMRLWALKPEIYSILGFTVSSMHSDTINFVL